MNEKQTALFLFKLKVQNTFLNIKEKIKNVFWKVVNYCRDLIANRPEVFVAIISLFAGIARMIFKNHTVRRHEKINTEVQRLKENYFYDRRAGHYVETYRALKGSELRELDRRYKNGESYSTILTDMKLIK